MAVRITHTNNSDGHDGTFVYHSTSPMDPLALPEPITDEPPVALGDVFEFIDFPGDGTHYYRTQDHEGGQVSTVSDEVTIDVGFTAQIGDEVEGGIYAGIDTIGSTDYHIIAGKAASEADGLQWKIENTTTPGTDSDTDGLANTQAMEAAGITDHPAAEHCLAHDGGGHNDWHMPAISQLSLMYNNLAGHDEFATNVSSGDYTWSSTEASIVAARIRRFSDGADTNGTKDATVIRVRPIRRIEA